MAKKSMVERELKRQRLVKQYAAKRASLKDIANNQDLPMEERFKARLKLAELPRNSLAHPAAQPLPADRPSACVLPQAETLADHAARPGLVRPDPRHGQVELVRRSRCQ